MKFVRVLLIAVLISAHTPLSSAEVDVYMLNDDNGVEVSERISLSLHETLQLAVLNNFDVQLNLYDRLIKEAELDDAVSIYDTVLQLTAEYNYDRNEQASAIFGSSSHTGAAGAKITKLLPSGTDLSFDFQSARDSSNSAFATMNPAYESTLEMKFTQPLLRNFFGMYDWGGVKITRIDVNNYSSEVLDKIEKNLADVEKAYWELAVALRLADIADEMYLYAEEFHEVTKKKRKLGTAEATDLLAAEANMIQRRSELGIEEAALRRAMNKLKLLINYPDGRKYIIPSDSAEIKDRDFALIPSLKTAFESRRDYRRARDDIKAKKIKFNMERNARWPQLDLEGSLLLNGVERNWQGAAADAFTHDNPEYNAKITFSFPFEDRDARSRYDAAKNNRAKALIKLKKVEKTIVTEIDDIVRKARAYNERARDARKVEALQKEKLAEEEKQFGYGRSDSDRMIRFQEDLLRASVSAFNSFKEYRHSVIDLYLTEDTYLTRRGLVVR